MPIRSPGSRDAMAEAAAGLTLSDLINSFGIPRYGMPTDQKERLAEGGSLPGSPQPPNYRRAGPGAMNPAEYDEASNRYASGYLFAQQYPRASRYLQPLIDELKTSPVPWFGGSSPEVQSYARQGGQQARLDYENRARAGTIGDLIKPPPKPPK